MSAPRDAVSFEAIEQLDQFAESEAAEVQRRFTVTYGVRHYR